MNSKNTKEILDKYPEFFEHLKDYEGPIIPIQFGFECNDGWFWLLDNLMNIIKNYCVNNNKPIPQVTQIKEKWGGLNFNVASTNELVYGMIWLTESLSYSICEDCGSHKGRRADLGWIYTLCPDCEEKKIKEKGIHLANNTL